MRPLGGAFEPRDALVAKDGIIACGLPDQQALETASGQQGGGRKGGSPFATGLLATGQDDGNVRAATGFRVMTGTGGQEGGNTAFHVRTAASIDTPVDKRPGEGRIRPRLASQRNGIEMSGKAQIASRSLAGRMGDEIDPALTEPDDRNLEADGIEDVGAELCAGNLVAGRIQAGNPDQALKKRDGVGIVPGHGGQLRVVSQSRQLSQSVLYPGHAR